jgi:hypothetical protein
MASLLLLYADTIDWWKMMFPSINFDCPFKRGPNYGNFSGETLDEETYDAIIKSLFGVMKFPNGVYRNTIKLYIKTDPMVLMFTFYVEHHTGFGEESF